MVIAIELKLNFNRFHFSSLKNLTYIKKNNLLLTKVISKNNYKRLIFISIHKNKIN